MFGAHVEHLNGGTPSAGILRSALQPTWRLAALVCLIAGLFAGVRIYLTYTAFGVTISMPEALSTGMLEWGVWALLAPLVLILARRLTLRRSAWVLGLLAHLALGAALSLLHVVLFSAGSSLARHWRFGMPLSDVDLRNSFLQNFPLGVLVYLAAVFGLQALAYWQRWRSEQLRSASVTRQLAQAQLQVLQLHLRPHFLFNALNSACALVRTEPEAAERVLAQLGDLLRRALSTVDVPEITLREELDFLQCYLAIESVRFSDRLHIRLELPEETRDGLVPTMLLQPLVENALQHGLQKAAGPGTLVVRAGRIGEQLWIEVEDDGLGTDSGEETPTHGGLGISNSRRRLERMYGAHQRLELKALESGGTCVRLELPWHTTPGLQFKETGA